MSGVIFCFDELASELEALAVLAGNGFLVPGSDQVIRQAAAALRRLKRERGNQVWETDRRNPIISLPSRGYQKGGKGAYQVYAKISWKWIMSIESKKKRAAPAENLTLDSMTSTRIDLVRCDGELEEQLLSWVMDVADSNSPGAHFHLQVKNIPSGGHSELDIPRIPGILLTPAEQLDFVLGELFQEEWPKRQSAYFSGNQNARIRECQQNRARLLFEGMRDAVCAAGPPQTAWQRLKSWKPMNLSLLGEGA